MPNSDEINKVIREVSARVTATIDIPDSIKEMFYRGVAKKELGEDMILRAKVEIIRINKWKIPHEYAQKNKEGNN